MVQEKECGASNGAARSMLQFDDPGVNGHKAWKLVTTISAVYIISELNSSRSNFNS